MEKITLKPQIKELLFNRSEEPGTHFDVLSCPGATTQEKSLGSLFIVSHIKFTDEDLSFLVNLASSLAKREYYSEQSLAEQSPKSAFNRALRKLNEVLEEFFQNKKFRLNMGLVSISGNNICISRLGKFKVSLARNSQLIDVLNNIELFDKDVENEKQFSNIISGKLQPGDKILAYYPLRSVVSREKQLNAIFTDVGQEEFNQKLVQLAANAKNFSCCGIHIQMQQIKEMAIRPSSLYSVHATSTVSNSPQDVSAPSSPKEEETQTKPQTPPPTNGKEKQSVAETNKKERPISAETTSAKPYIIPAELSVGKRPHPLSAVAGYTSKLKNLGRLNSKTRARIFFSIAATVIVPLLIFAGFKTFGAPSEVKKALISSRENLRLAQSYLNQNNVRGGRSLLYQALATISLVKEDKKNANVRSEINKTLATVDKISDQKPTQFADLSQNLGEPPAKTSLISSFAKNALIILDSGVVLAVGQNGATEIAKITFPARHLFGATDAVAAYDGEGQLWSFDLKKEKAASHILKEPTRAVDAAVYENNLYVLSAGSIYKYTDAVSGGTSRTNWINNLSDDSVAIAADSNVYILTATGRLETYFKGAKTGELDLQISPAPGSRLFAFKDSALAPHLSPTQGAGLLYLTDKTNARIYVFDKATGSLKTSYDLSSAGTITDISVSSDGSGWILSSDNKVWTIIGPTRLSHEARNL